MWSDEFSEIANKALANVSRAAVEAFKKLSESITEAAKIAEERTAAAEEMLYDYLNALIEAAVNSKEYPTTSDLLKELSELRWYKDLRDPIPKTPYKPSFKTVIFDRRLKFPKCRSNCR